MDLQRSRLVLRIGLLMLAFESGLIAVHALFFPEYFYAEFLLGRGWVQMLPPYNEHITRDLGALYLGFLAVLGYAAVRLSRELTNGALLGFFVATAPHAIFHAEHYFDAPLLLDRILQVGLLTVTLVVSAGLYALGRRYFSQVGERGSRPAERATAPAGDPGRT